MSWIHAAPMFASPWLATLDDATLIGLVWKSALVLALAALCASVMRRAAAASRHLVWNAAMVGLLLLPVFALVLPAQSLAVLPRVVASEVAAPSENSVALPARVGVPVGPREDEVGATGSESSLIASKFQEEDFTGATVGEAEAADIQATPWTTRTLLLLVWALGALSVFAPTVLGHALAFRRVRRARFDAAPSTLSLAIREIAARVGLRNPPRVLMTSLVQVPMACGLMRPAVLLPSETTNWSHSKLRSVLLHEFAHVLRWDCMSQFFARIALALFWFNPLAWYAVRRMIVERERACDDLVLRAGVRAEEYAESLLDVARHGRATAWTGMASVLMARPSQLEGRLLSILDAGRRRSALTWRALCGVFALAIAALLPIATLQLTAREALGLEFLGGETAILEWASSDDRVLEVAADGSATYSRIQEAIDAAPAGARVRIAEGEYRESLVVRKPITLEGAGWEKTRVLGANGASSALTIELTSDVQVKGLRFSVQGEHKEGTLGSSAIVNVFSSKAILEDCVIADGPANGVVIRGDSNAKLSSSLIAAVWAEGVLVEGPAVANITRCDIRNLYHYGVKIRVGSEVTVESCRISGAGWHAIRYDDASPTIQYNRLFNNKRFGIYANGETRAKVLGNFIYGNEMAGIACWGGSSDTITGNHLAGNHRSGIEILGESNPRLRNNRIEGSKVGVTNGNVTAMSPYVSQMVGVDFTDNHFANNVVNAAFHRLGMPPDPAKDEALLLSRGNTVGEPRLDQANSLDTHEKAGPSIASISEDSPWPALPEEAAFTGIHEGDARGEGFAGTAQNTYNNSGEWIADVLQIEDAQRREAGLEKIRAAIASANESTQLAGLVAFLATIEVNYDKTSFRPIVMPCTQSSNAVLQERAFYALFNTGAQAGDLERLLIAVCEGKPELLASASHLIHIFSHGNIEGDASDVLLELFQSSDSTLVRELLRGLWGARLSPSLEAHLLELAKTSTGRAYHDVIYFALSTQANKSEAAIDELFRAAQVEDSNTSGRALWGLAQGVSKEHERKVADFALKYFSARGSSGVRDKATTLIVKYADAGHLPQVEALAQNDLLGAPLRERFEKLAASLKQR